MAQIAVLALGLGAAVFTDVRTRRIPNALTGALRGGGAAAADGARRAARRARGGVACGGRARPPSRARLGFVVGLVLMLPGHVMAASGAGDVKLMAAVG